MQNKMKITSDKIKIDNKEYQLSLEGNIRFGDTVYNPLSDVIMIIDEEDDISYVNDNYYLVVD
jgi:lipopolysaccharide assembly outer membrane protein LptD (OstA)